VQPPGVNRSEYSAAQALRKAAAGMGIMSLAGERYAVRNVYWHKRHFQRDGNSGMLERASRTRAGKAPCNVGHYTTEHLSS